APPEAAIRGFEATSSERLLLMSGRARQGAATYFSWPTRRDSARVPSFPTRQARDPSSSGERVRGLRGKRHLTSLATMASGRYSLCAQRSLGAGTANAPTLAPGLRHARN